MLSVAHVFLSSVALLIGGIIFWRPKGTRWHRAMGKVYSISMIGLSVAAFGIYHLTGRFNLFHFTAILSLVLVLTGWGQVIFRRRLRNWLYRHYVYMCWSYVALVAAAFNEGYVRVPAMKAVAGRNGNWVIIATQLVLVLSAAAVISRRRREMLARYGAEKAG